MIRFRTRTRTEKPLRSDIAHCLIPFIDLAIGVSVWISCRSIVGSCSPHSIFMNQVPVMNQVCILNPVRAYLEASTLSLTEDDPKTINSAAADVWAKKI